MTRTIDYGLGPKEVRALHLPEDKSLPHIRISPKRDHTGRDVISVVCDDPYVFVEMSVNPDGSILYKSRAFVATVRHTESGFPYWISFRDHRSTADVHDWRVMQGIKNALVGPEAEAVELFPAESRLVDESNQFHLWCFPEQLGFGFEEREVFTAAESDRIYELKGQEGMEGRQRPFPRHIEARKRKDEDLLAITDTTSVRRIDLDREEDDDAE